MAHLHVYIVVISLICLVIMISATVFHIRQEHQANKNARITKKPSHDHDFSSSLKAEANIGWFKLLVISNYLAIYGYIFHVLLILILEVYTLTHHPLSDTDCRLKWSLTAFGVHFTKFCVYLLFITRIYCCFMSSAYGYSIRLFIGLYTYLFIYLVIASLNDFYFIDATWDQSQHLCKLSVPFVSVLFTFFVDISLSALSIVLFIRPLYRIMHVSNCIDASFVNVAIKKCILVFIALLSTMIAVVLLMTTRIALLQLNDLINLLCILFMFKIHYKWYQNICGRICHKRIAVLLGSSQRFTHKLMINFEESINPKDTQQTAQNTQQTAQKTSNCTTAIESVSQTSPLPSP
eukprot:271742_1